MYSVWICRDPISLDSRDPIFSDFRDPMIIFSDSRDPNWVPKTPKITLYYMHVFECRKVV